MARIGRSFQAQALTSAGPYLGPRKPTALAPVVTTLSINLATGLFTNQRRAQMRFPRQGWEPGLTQTTGASPQTLGSLSRLLGPTPPELISPPPPATQQQQTIAVSNVRQAALRASLAMRPTIASLPGPTVVSTPEEPSQRVQTIQSTTVLTRPPFARAELRAPTVVTSVVFIAEPITVTLTHVRPRATSKQLFEPTVLQVFAGPQVEKVRTRPRPSAHFLGEPTVIRVPSVEQREQQLSVSLAHTRPRPTTHALGKPTVLQVFATGKPALALTRPRKTSWKLAPPTLVRVPSVEQQEDTIRVALVHTRPRPTSKALGKPTVLIVPSVEQKRVTLTAWLTKTRPRPTNKRLAPPTVVLGNPPVVTTLSVVLGAVRRATEQRRHVVAHFLRAPTVVIPLPTLRMQTISVALDRIRPRPTRRFLAKPTVLQVFFGPQSILTKTRPRHTSALLAKPTALRTFVGPAISRTRTRPRPTVHFLRPPTLVRVPSVEQREDSITVSLARTRPRPTTHRLIGPTVLRSFVAAPLRVALTRVRPRRTTQRLTLTSPTAPAVTTLLSRITRIRPPRTTVALSAGIILSRPSQLAQTIRTTLVTVRPRATQKLLAQPVRVAPPPTLAQQTLRVAYENAVTTRTSLLRRPSSHLIHPPTAVRTPRDAEFELGELGDGWHAGMPTEGWQSGERAPDWSAGGPSTGWLSDTIGGSWRADKPQS